MIITHVAVDGDKFNVGNRIRWISFEADLTFCNYEHLMIFLASPADTITKSEEDDAFSMVWSFRQPHLRRLEPEVFIFFLEQISRSATVNTSWFS